MKTRLLAALVLLLAVADVQAAAPAAQPTANATARVRLLKEQIKSFRLNLAYHGDQDKPYYGLTLSVASIIQTRSSPFQRIVQISEEQANRIIDHLAAEGFLDQAIDAASKKLPAPSTPCYTMSAWSGEEAHRHEFYVVLGWGLPLLKRLDGLRAVLEGDAARQMDLLLDRLSGHRKQWNAQAESRARLVAGVKAVLPKGWECSLTSELGKMGHPHGLEEPLFRLDFTNSNEWFEYDVTPPGKRRVHPSLRLHVHAIQDKQRIMKVIEAESRYSWDIPLYFAETNDYLIVTSPPWINQGCYAEEARKLVAPLEQALKKAATTQPLVESKAVEKDGLSITASMQQRPIPADEQPQVAVRFKNVSGDTSTCTMLRRSGTGRLN